jgi:hypothetical protein
MPYIGKTPLTGAYQLCDAITTSATATYNLTVGSSPVIPGAAQNCIVSLNGVVQAPVGAYTVSGSTIVFASTLSATDVIDFILILGNVFDIGKPTDGSVTNASIANSTINLTTKVTGVLPVANGGTNLSSGFANGIIEADQWRLTADTNSGTDADVTTNWERNDSSGYASIGTGMTESSGIFSFPTTGIYLITFFADMFVTSGDTATTTMSITQNNSTFSQVGSCSGTAQGASFFNKPTTSFIFDVTNISNDKVKFTSVSFSAGTLLRGDTTTNETLVNFIRLGDT